MIVAGFPDVGFGDVAIVVTTPWLVEVVIVAMLSRPEPLVPAEDSAEDREEDKEVGDSYKNCQHSGLFNWLSKPPLRSTEFGQAKGGWNREHTYSGRA